ncbi:HAD-IIB family hydrolase [Natronospirillum operosum]|uniref:HAD-IIB family hydrolase n=1 Tax=Natronospirillum operosum TaxID=2759953 RepID=A0A4Z0W6Y4_9GAMM|nr:HAD-IIB family hydrolase [Natronospirillum operosum]TGG90252.1 HAD-IIB family hydrolase [Natronospirillum operosum]
MNPVPDFRPIRFLFTDVDDTLTTEGRLLPQTYQALWDLAGAGIAIIPVTGGCAGWCDQILRTWPVQAVIGEGGAFYATRLEGAQTQWRYWRSREEHRRDQAAILNTLKTLALPFEVQLAQDQSFRHVDVAVDYNQEARLTPAQAAEVRARLAAAGYSVKQSSIHINVWQGEFDKCAMARRYLSEQHGLSPEAMQQGSFFIGDAPNDESMFEFFPNNAGVANIAQHLPQMQAHPATITRGRSGHGVVELVACWLEQIGTAVQ